MTEATARLRYEPTGNREARRSNPEFAKFSRDLFTDYYQSFRLAQGSVEAQAALFSLLGAQHQAAEQLPLVGAALAMSEHRIDDLMPPVRHIATTANMRASSKNGFQAVWDLYKSRLQDEAYHSAGDTGLILRTIVTEDLRYQFEARQGRLQEDDPHESVLREYVLGDRLKGSQQLMEVREMLREEIVPPLLIGASDTYTEIDQLHELSDTWEGRHLGKVFTVLPDD